MGEISEMIQDGTLCRKCGGLVESLIIEGSNILKKAPGHTQLCDSCKKQAKRKNVGKC